MKPRGRASLLLVLFFMASVAIAGAIFWRSGKKLETVPETKLAEHRPLEVLADGYVSSNECQSCHEKNYDSWQASYHRTMTQLASPETVHGDFSVPPMTFDGRYYELQKRGDQFWAVMDDPDSRPDRNDPDATRIERPMALVTGSHHLQMYWYPVGQSRLLGLLPVHYFKDDNLWLPASATMLRPPGEFTSDTGRWNVRCIQCHTTHGRTRPEAAGADSQVAEFGISCEACHGPSESHVRLRRDSHLAAKDGGNTERDSIVNPSKLDSKTASQICGLCHSYTMAKSQESENFEATHGFHFRPGDQLTDSLVLERRDEATREHLKSIGARPDAHFDERFWSDGMVRVAGREYNGMIESGCFEQGEMSCMSCHSMHKRDDDTRSMKDWADHQLIHARDSNDACIQCHAADRYAASSHTHHPEGSQGSRCYNCHMPYTTYGLLRALRSHQIESPNVATSVSTGRPNGCNLCHLDKPLGWTANYLSEWFQQPVPKLSEDEQQLSAAALWALSGDAGQRAIVAWNMGWAPAIEASGGDWMPPVLTQLMQDNYDAIRRIGFKSLSQLPGYQDVAFNFVGPVPERNTAIRQVMDRWSKRDREMRAEPATVLLDEQGNVEQKTVDRLLLRRNRRSVVLLE